MRLLAKLTGGRVHNSGSIPSPEGRASARPPAFFSAEVLEAAITASEFVRREPNDDGERVVVLCNALGGAFVYSRMEVERRIMLKFPGLALDEVAAATRYLEDRLRAYLKPIETKNRRNTSWIAGWRGDY
jgi:hypothetical protein